jgi:hypothetical protein
MNVKGLYQGTGEPEVSDPSSYYRYRLVSGLGSSPVSSALQIGIDPRNDAPEKVAESHLAAASRIQNANTITVLTHRHQKTFSFSA